MYQAVQRGRGRVALAASLCVALAGALTVSRPASAAGPLLLSPLLSTPAVFDVTRAAPAADLLTPPAFDYLTGLSGPGAEPTASASPPFTLDLGPFDPSLGRDWSAARRADPTLHLADWRQVFNVARLGAFVIPLRDDPAERTNILLAAQAVDNTSVAPGQVFSFNHVVGERTPERGYQEGLVFSQGQVIRGTGGGICLVATGLYNAALQAGLPLLERHTHSGFVSYAPPGCDASVVYGSEDMQFQNTTHAPLVVKAQPDLESERVVIALYGATPPPGRKVYVKATHLDYIPYQVITKPDPTLPAGSPPVVDQKPHRGYDVTIERFWTEGARIVRHEVVTTEHRGPRAKIVRIPLPTPPAVPGVLPGTAAPLPGVLPPTVGTLPVELPGQNPSSPSAPASLGTTLPETEHGGLHDKPRTPLTKSKPDSNGAVSPPASAEGSGSKGQRGVARGTGVGSDD